MLEPFTTLHEAGFSVPGADAAGWSVEAITALDWMRLAELARALAAEAGCELAGSRAMADGSVLFGMIEQPRSPKPQRALVKLAPWNEWGANTGTVERFAQEVATARDTRGILIAPAGFRTAAPDRGGGCGGAVSGATGLAGGPEGLFARRHHGGGCHHALLPALPAKAAPHGAAGGVAALAHDRLQRHHC
jgi:hypothetical protein